MADLTRMIHDVKSTYNSFESCSRIIINPFDTIYVLTYCLTMRIVGCNELADDCHLVKRMLTYTEYVESSGTPMSIIFPWFPWPAIIKRYYAFCMIYLTLKLIIWRRRISGTYENDGLQFMLDQGDEVTHAIAVSES
jgi:hypothetical protein